ncbi:MAG: class I SAM-dependent methyltransferase [Chloroflexi bacterium]|nr:MAG: class I SAM-dependent methyltransferase [Chloroflexota bacterium]
MSDPLRRVRHIYEQDPEAYHRAMSSRFTEWMLGGRRRKVGEAVRGLVLDVGFGTGLSVPYYPADVRVVGIDISPKMLEVGKRFAKEQGRHADVLVMDAERLALPDHVFDSVAFNLCLCTIPNPEAAAREGVRVAKPGAAMVFLEHVRSHLLPVALLEEAVNPAMVALQADHFTRRTAEVVGRSGVEVLSIDRWFAGVFNLIVGRAPAR